MSFVPHVLLCCSIAICLTTVQALPKCAADDERCHERLMHPELPVAEPQLARAVDGENTKKFWIDQGKEHVKEKLAIKPNTNRAKNVIMFLGDGMGLTTVAAARNLIGGEEKCLSFEKFPYTGLSKTYSVDKIVPDSACTATAYLCGVKAMYGTLGVNGNVERENCVTMLDKRTHVDSIAMWALDAGKSAGVVTTTRVTHASPAAAYAHIAERDWEDDTEVMASCGADSGIEDIAYQLVHGKVGSKLKLVMGGGKRHFAGPNSYANGSRSDGLNLVEDFLKQNTNNVFVETRQQLMDVDLKKTKRLMGLFADGHLKFHLETDEFSTQPTLEEMTRTAIEYMSQDENGYFLFIEGGRIDSGHHDNMARLALDETVEFSKAIQAARELTNEEETLIVVTADHSHAFSYAGYSYRGSDIFGKTRSNADDKKPLLTLSYSNGPGFENFYDVKKHERRDPTQVLTGDAHDMFPSTFPRSSETHGGEDVPVFASGPWAHLFTGVYEQNAIPHLMGYASCLGNGLTMCDKNSAV